MPTSQLSALNLTPPTNSALDSHVEGQGKGKETSLPGQGSHPNTHTRENSITDKASPPAGFGNPAVPPPAASHGAFLETGPFGVEMTWTASEPGCYPDPQPHSGRKHVSSANRPAHELQAFHKEGSGPELVTDWNPLFRPLSCHSKGKRGVNGLLVLSEHCFPLKCISLRLGK